MQYSILCKAYFEMSNGKVWLFYFLNLANDNHASNGSLLAASGGSLA